MWSQLVTHFMFKINTKYLCTSLTPVAYKIPYQESRDVDLLSNLCHADPPLREVDETKCHVMPCLTAGMKAEDGVTNPLPLSILVASLEMQGIQW